MSGVEKKLANLSLKQRKLLEKRLQLSQNKPEKGDDNRVLLSPGEGAEELLAHFYGKYPWPWRPLRFEFLSDPLFETTMLNQDVGDWEHQTVPPDAQVWVAGCGTNQAIITALRFPQAQIIASDISRSSLDLAKKTADQLQLKNLELREESINEVSYKEEFHYIICTGVIHHNADPQKTLAMLSKALRPEGILELMVYNRFHRLVTSAFQKAMRIFSEDKQVDFEEQLRTAKQIIAQEEIKNGLEKAFVQFMEWSDVDLADLLIQPVEHSYTVESLASLVDDCDLYLSAPCLSPYAKFLAKNSWEMEFDNLELEKRYWFLPDIKRWQMTNLLWHEKSPLLWFYLRKKGQGKNYSEICRSMLKQKFCLAQTEQRMYLQKEEDYILAPQKIPYPTGRQEKEKSILSQINPTLSLGDILEKEGTSLNLSSLHKIRLHLTSSAFPYLQSTSS